jgi:Na+/H+-dicarboxylate symporter
LIRSLSFWVLVALIAGIALGAAVEASGHAGATAAIEGVEAIGGLWLNALRMTIVPLVLALIVNGVATTADVAATGRLAARSALLFLALLLVAAAYGVLASQGLLALWPADPAGAAALRAGAGGAEAITAVAPGFGQWLTGLAPANPIKAAAEDAILPLVVFGLFLGFALTRLPAETGQPLTRLFGGLAEAMIVIVRWVLLAAPIGVFALALGVGLRAGLGATGVLVHYVIFVTGITAGVCVIAYLIGVAAGRVPAGRFARACIPVWVVAFSTQSSLACQPAKVERAQDSLAIPPRVTGVVLPLAVAVFRFTSPVANLAVVCFVAHIYGVHPTALQFASAVVVALAMSIGSVGLPGQVSFFASIAPICLVVGAPVELLPILLAVEVIPDIFRTVGNVTGDMAVTAILSRGQRGEAIGAEAT